MIIEFLDGQTFDIEKRGMIRLFHYIPPLTILRESIKIPGRSGSIPVGYSYGERTIKVQLMYKVADIYDFYLFRDEVNAKFAMREPFYITFKREPYKRWFVSLAAPFEIEPNKQAGEFELEFVCENVFAESVGTCQQLVDRNFDSGLWGWGSGIDVDKEYAYSFDKTNFIVENIGTADIDPHENNLRITVRGTFPKGFSMTNTTTGETYMYTAALAANDTLRIDNVRTFRNGVSDFKHAKDGQLISLRSGPNNLNIDTRGGTLTSVVFDFKFLYK